MTSIDSFDKLEDFGRVRLSHSFFMRDFLHSEIAQWHGLRNTPDFPEQAIEVGRQLCEQLLEPLQATFGRIHIRSGYRSPRVNDFGNRNRLNCASNEANHAAHIWDYPDAQGLRGATACIVLPWLVDRISKGGQWTEMAWWIHDHLPYSSLYFFPKLAAFNINWHESPKRRIDSYADPKGCLTKPGMPNHAGLHPDLYSGYPSLVRPSNPSHAPLSTPSTQAVVRVPPMAPTAPIESVDPDEAALRLRDMEGQQPTKAVDLAAPVNVMAPHQVATGHSLKTKERAVVYRAIHTKTRWRKVGSHRSLEAALHGKDGAEALFKGKVRIDYEKHGQPLYVLVWVQGDGKGYALRPSPATAGATETVEVDASVLAQLDQQASVSDQELADLFGRKSALSG